MDGTGRLLWLLIKVDKSACNATAIHVVESHRDCEELEVALIGMEKEGCDHLFEVYERRTPLCRVREHPA